MIDRVFVTGAGGPSAISFMRAVGSHTELFSGDVDPYAAGLYLVEDSHRRILLRGDDPDFADHLLHVCRELDVNVLVPTVDNELLPVARRRDEFERSGIRVVLAHVDTLELCLDKWKLIGACERVCPVPATSVLTRELINSEPALPLLVKPRHGAGGRGVVVIRKQAELELCSDAGDLIAQEFLTGREYSVDVLYSPSRERLAVVPRARLKVDSGISVTGITIRSEQLQSYATAVAERIRVTYVANIQFRDDACGRPKLLEVNARFPGGMPLTVAAGVNMPQLAIDLACGRPVSRGVGSFTAIAMVRTWQEHFVDVSEIAEQEAAAHSRDHGLFDTHVLVGNPT
ncbi:MAG: ATP-grasp domain-containing protein [bacterium]